MKTNIATWERALRVLVGVGLLVASLVVFRGAGTLGGWALVSGLALLGLDMLVIGISGFCPLYHKLGWGMAPAARNVA